MPTPNSLNHSTLLHAPIARVWKALTDHKEFGQWFKVNLESPFQPGRITKGRITHPGYEHVTMEVTVRQMQEPAHFSFNWHPYAIDPKVDYSQEPPTLVEFRLTPQGNSTHLTISESGFEKVPESRRDEAFRMNNHGWEIQLQNIAHHLAARSL